MKTIPLLLLAIVALIYGGCANPGIVQLSPDTYMLSKDDHGGIFGNANRLKANVIGEANAFAEKQGKIAIPLAERSSPVGGPGQWASFEYQFRVVDKNDPEARRTHLVPRADLVIEKTENSHSLIETKNLNEQKPDLYTEIMKLGELLKQGLITKEEYETQKQKLLNAAR